MIRSQRLKKNIKDKPDWSHSDDAIADIVESFVRKKTGRYLLVLPTGGGKTLIAIRAINELINLGELNKENRALWVVHTTALRRQTERERDKKQNCLDYGISNTLKDVLEIRMIIDGSNVLQGIDVNKYRIVIIDEAHHSAAVTYQPFFRNDVGILGLTATPTRGDGRQLKFDDGLYYSISFRELVNRKVLLEPSFVQIKTNIVVKARDLGFRSGGGQLESFNTEKRNKMMCSEIFKKIDQLNIKKIIVFVGTNNHVVELYKVLNSYNQSLRESKINHVGYIYGGNKNERGISNTEYLEDHLGYESSILVNCRILNEGYDDPSLDAVVMATPTSSILYYMQCIGRVVRRANVSASTKAYVLEMVDKLPNARYHIDNRWLYSEISDYLEPEIIDKGFKNIFDLKIKLSKLFSKYSVDDKYHRFLKDLKSTEDISLLLFNDIPAETEENPWYPILFTKLTKDTYTNMFNMISNNINEYYTAAYTPLVFGKLGVPKDDFFLSDRPLRVGLFVALHEAYNRKRSRRRINNIIYVLFRPEKHGLVIGWFYYLYYKARYLLN